MRSEKKSNSWGLFGWAGGADLQVLTNPSDLFPRVGGISKGEVPEGVPDLVILEADIYRQGRNRTSKNRVGFFLVRKNPPQ